MHPFFFLLKSTREKSIVNSPYIDNIMLLAAGVQELAIYPTPATTEVPTLKNTIPPPPRFPSRIHRHEDKHTVPSKYYYLLLPCLLFFFWKKKVTRY